MTAAAGRQATVAEDAQFKTWQGIVATNNPRGMRLEGFDVWFNYSATSAVERPQAGDRVRVVVDARRYVREVEIIEQVAPAVRSTPAPRAASRPDRDRLIVRQCVIKAAVEYAAARPTMNAGEMFYLAEKMEQWVYRAANGDDDQLQDIF